MTEHVVKVLQRTQLSHSQSDVKHFIYLHSKWLEDVTELELFLTSSNASYRATLKHDEVRSAAEDLSQPYNEFYAECKKALTTQMGMPGFDYDLDEQQLRFKLVKCLGFETFYVDVPIRKISNCHQLLDAAVECAHQPHQIDTSDSTAVLLETGASQSNNELLAEYEQYIKDAKLSERKLLKKFIMLINNKKQRIEELERKLEHRQNNTVDEAESDVGDPDDDDDVYCGATQAMTQRDLMQD
ncbi:uncharacterized protein LOC6558148 [Drosophila grimshawi]|uniref:GH16214 n=1 Tax=Drosophila grimshawi TaxID=7222 RepID=B4IXD8_DROGR|nr:uncharacterized protein LOC6558148 [Drosophila grimshawi]EDV96375.1 GH16214 [Drosophila grimshawi]